MRAFYRLTLLGLLFAPLGRAESPEPPQVSTTLLPVAIHRPLDGIYFRNGDKAVALSAGLSDLGQEVAYRGPQRLLLYGSAEACLENPPVTAPLTAVDLPLNSDRVLLLAFHPPGQAAHLVAYDAPTDGLRPGDYHFFNLSSHDLALCLGEEAFLLPRGRDRVASRPEWHREILDLKIQLATRSEAGTQLVYSSIWGHYPGKRSFVLLFDGAHPSMPVVMRKMHDQLPAAKP